MIMWEVTWLRNNSYNYARQLAKYSTGLYSLIIAVKNTMVSLEVGWTSFTYQIKLKNKCIIILSLQKMKNHLKQIVHNTEPKRSCSIVVCDNKTRFKTWFKSPIQLDKKKDYELALINLETYYSFPNIDRSNNWFTYSPNLYPLWFDVIIPEGSYHVEDINEFIRREMRKMATMIKQTIRITLKYLLIPTH